MSMHRPGVRFGGFIIGLAIVLSACVTINIYFPAAAAEKAAEMIVEDVLGAGKATIKETPAPADKAPAATGDKSGALEDSMATGLATVLNWLIPVAQAAPDFDVDTPAIRQIQARMKARNAELSPFYASGAAGFANDGTIQVRDEATVGLKDRARFKKLVSAENADRKSLYSEIAKANGHPEWEPEVRGVFAKKWADKANSGWWVQDAGGAWRKR